MRRSALLIALAMACGSASASGAWGREPPPAPEPPPGRLPSLDEALGLTEPGAGPAEGAVADPARAELDRALSPGERQDEFERAVALMGQSADRLLVVGDAGLATQRLQEEALRALDKLIDDAQKQRQSSRQRQQAQQQQQQQQSRPNQSTANQQAQASRDNQGTEPVGPARQDGALNPTQTGSTSAWGNLPEHLRSALMQGRSDAYSRFYERLTREYYRRLAEEPKP